MLEVKNLQEARFHRHLIPHLKQQVHPESLPCIFQ